MTPHEFLKLLWGNKPDDHLLLLWTFPDKRSHWFTAIDEAAEFAVANGSQRDVYIGMCASKTNLGPARRSKSEEVDSICGIGCDFDLKSAAHENKPLPTTLNDAFSFMPDVLTPSVIIATGNGAHAWWLLKEPLVFDSEEERTAAAHVVARWHTFIRAKYAARGWVYDRLWDLARILRIPGTQNHKDPARPKNVTLHSITDRRYNLSDFEELLDEMGVPDPEAEERAAREWKERFADKPLVIDLRARIPDDLLAAWMDTQRVDPQTAMKFKNTWEKQRHDLKDQSGSGYDLALADFGVDAGLSPQQIVDLIIHHRARHSAKPRTRLDYYQRTISKAEKRGKDRVAIPAVPGAEGSVPTTAAAPHGGAPAAPEAARTPEDATQPPPQPDADIQRERLYRRISEALTVAVARLVKIPGKESQYRMELSNCAKVEFPNVNKFLSQEAVRSALADKAKKLIPPIARKRWDAVAQMMLDACVDEQATEETDWVGSTVMQLELYLAESTFIPSVASQKLSDQRKPIVEDGVVTICSSDFLTYLNKTTFQNLNIRAVTSNLSAIGATTKKVRGVGNRYQSRWALPIEYFDPANYQQWHEAGGSDAAE